MRHDARTCDCAACQKMRDIRGGRWPCFFCNKPASEGHHISNRSVGAKDHVPENIAPLCFSCHRPGIHQHGRKDWPRRMGRPELTRESLAVWERDSTDIAREGGEWEEGR